MPGPFASADLAQLAAIREVTFGVTPNAGNGFNLRMTGESLEYNLTKTPDKEMSYDGQPNSTTTTNAAAVGDIKVHMQYAEYDPFLAGVMRSAWVPFGTNGVGATFSGTFTAGTLGTVASTITASVATSGTSLFTNLQPGQWLMITAPGAAGVDQMWVRNSLTVAASATVITLDVNTPIAAAAGVALCTISSSRLTNGVTKSSFSIEKQFSDVSQYLIFTGLNVSKFSTALTSAAQTEATFSMMGAKSTRAPGGVTQLPGTSALSQTYDIQNGVTGVGALWEAGVPLTSTSIKKIDFNIDSKLRAQDALGTLGAVGMGVGTIESKGTLEVYFATGALYDKFVTDTYTSLVFSTKDSAGNGYVVTLPRVMLTGAKILAGGKNTDVMASFNYECYADRKNAVPALRKTIIIDRLGAAVLPL